MLLVQDRMYLAWRILSRLPADGRRSSSGGAPPRWGADRDFDKHFREQFGTAAVADSEEEAELRR